MAYGNFWKKTKGAPATKPSVAIRTRSAPRGLRNETSADVVEAKAAAKTVTKKNLFTNQPVSWRTIR